MKTITNFILFLSLFFIAVSCSSDDDGNNIAPQAIKYEVTGNFSGKLDAAFSREGNEDIIVLPWIKEFTTAQGTSSVTLIVTGTGGAPGQTVTLKIYVGDVVKEEYTATANSSGSIIGFRSYNF